MGWWEDLKGGAQSSVSGKAFEKSPLFSGTGTPWAKGGWETYKDKWSNSPSLWTSGFSGMPGIETPGSIDPRVGFAENIAGKNDPTDAPKYEKYKGFNPSEYSAGGFDSSQMSKNMQRDIASGSAQRRQQQLAQLGKMGVRGADTTAAMGRVGSEQERAVQNIQAQLARQNYEDAWRQYMAGNADWNKQQDRNLEAWQAQEQMKAEDKAANSLNIGTIASLYGMSGGFGKKGK